MLDRDNGRHSRLLVCDIEGQRSRPRLSQLGQCLRVTGGGVHRKARVARQPQSGGSSDARGRPGDQHRRGHWSLVAFRTPATSSPRGRRRTCMGPTTAPICRRGQPVTGVAQRRWRRIPLAHLVARPGLQSGRARRSSTSPRTNPGSRQCPTRGTRRYGVAGNDRLVGPPAKT